MSCCGDENCREIPPAQRPLGLFARIGNLPFIGLILLYRVTLSPFMGGQCRFQPTCSRYGLEAYRTQGPLVGTRLTVWRILRCHPFNKGGYDPVPIRDDAAQGTYDMKSDVKSTCDARNEASHEASREDNPEESEHDS